MSLKELFRNISSKKAAGLAIATSGGILAIIDTFRLAAGDISVLGGTSFTAAFAAHAGMISSGLSLLPKSEEPRKTVIIRGFQQEEPTPDLRIVA